ncbi:21156_t:CDS:2 [Entrophospora sp. SA101]|nr:21156_t:CDS:2 [Entrophospora sp. SA101]CAJ0910058.1 12064_t:CDS:2 [Entrophospora sp. SA101]
MPKLINKINYYEKDTPDKRLTKLLIILGDKMSPQEIHSNIGIVSNLIQTEYAKYEINILKAIKNCFMELPTKTFVYGTLIGLLNVARSDIGAAIVKMTSQSLQQCLNEGNWRGAKLSLKFFAELTNSNVILPRTMLDIYDDLLTTLDEPNVKMVATRLHDRSPDILEGILSKIERYFYARDRAIKEIDGLLVLNSVRPYVGSNIPYEQVDTLELLWTQIQKFKNNNWKVIHTSKTIHGQIYIPEINYILMIATVLVCIAFQKSENLTNAYGVAVITVIFISTILVSIVICVVWNLPLIASIIFLLTFGLIDVSFMGATFLKVQYGGWFTLVFGFVLCVMMRIWRWGTNLQLRYVMKNKTSLENIFMTEDDYEREEGKKCDVGDGSSDSAVDEDIAIDSSTSSVRKRKNNNLLKLKTNQYPVVRLPGIGLFYNEVTSGIPITFNHFINHLPSLPEILIFITIRPLAIPYVGKKDRLVVQRIRKYKGFYKIIARYALLECYVFLINNSRQLYGNWNIPIEDVIDVGMKIAV